MIHTGERPGDPMSERLPSEPSAEAIEAAYAVSERQVGELRTEPLVRALRAAYAVDADAAANHEDVASFGDPEGPAWQRGHLEKADEGEPLVEMACCAFRFSSYHSDDAPDNGKGHVIGGSLMYSCPMCAPDGMHNRAVDADAVVAARVAALTDEDVNGLLMTGYERYDDPQDESARIYMREALRARLLREEQPRG